MYVATIRYPNELATAVKTNKDTIFYKTFFGYPPKVRAEILKAAEISTNYVKKQVYVKDGAPVFRFANALKLDKASKGAFDVFRHGEGAADIDPVYLKQVAIREIKRRRQARLLAGAKATAEVLTDTP